MAENTSITAADIMYRAGWSDHGQEPSQTPRELSGPCGGSGNRALFDLAQGERWLADSDRMLARVPRE